MLGYILLAYLLIYFAIAFVLPSYRVWKRTGVNPVTFSGAETAHDYIGKLFKIVMQARHQNLLLAPEDFDAARTEATEKTRPK